MVLVLSVVYVSLGESVDILCGSGGVSLYKIYVRVYKFCPFVSYVHHFNLNNSKPDFTKSFLHGIAIDEMFTSVSHSALIRIVRFLVMKGK